MNNRTDNITLIKADVVYLASDLYPALEPDPSDVYVITEIGDRLDLLANTFYNGRTDYWVIIAMANEGVGEGTVHVEPGIQLRIPGNISRFDRLIDTLNNH